MKILSAAFTCLLFSILTQAQSPGNTWTFIKGDSAIPLYPVFGQKGVPGAANKPSARQHAGRSRDGNGNLYLFGGSGNGNGGNDPLALNDLWRYSTSSGQWTWLSGDSLRDQPGVTGTKGVAAAANKPGSRESMYSANNSIGELYIFGGYGKTTTTAGFLNDLWKYSPSTGMWTWLSGDNATASAAVYGTKGVANAANKPGARMNGVMWVDGSDNVWIYGGQNTGYGILNELWRFTPANNQWTWMGGETVTNIVGVYGTKGTPTASTKPGSRYEPLAMTDASGNLWLYGGTGYGEASGSAGTLGDLWKYTVSSNQWTWVSGDKIVNQSGVYGTKGVANAANKPGARSQTVGAASNSNNFLIYGGAGYGAPGGYSGQRLNDLWSFSVSTGQWTWLSGDATTEVELPGIFGTMGVESASNKPSTKYAGVGWADANGNLWVFGGLSTTLDVGTTYSNELWRYRPSTSQWTWMNGDNSSIITSIFGTKGVAAPNNKPGGRSNASTWTDAAGNLWLFGGLGINALGENTYLNELWKFSPTSRQWTFVGGTTTGPGVAVYGTQGTAAAGNTPGARTGAITWRDNAGNLYLFSGTGFTADPSDMPLNDLWRYSIQTGQWTWISGSDTYDETVIYGTKGVAASANTPGYRSQSASALDASGNLLLFGGNSPYGDMSDLWRFNISSGWWSWIGGDNYGGVTTTYGTKGTPSASNNPGSRYGHTAWTDATGNFYVFGGKAFRPTEENWEFNYNDLWRYNLTTGQWTWLTGDNFSDATGVYGTKKVAAGANKPGARSYGLGFTDPTGNLWLMGGYGFATATGFIGDMNDHWKYTVATGQWTWMAGSNAIQQGGIYSSANTANITPGARENAASWRDLNGDQWIMGGSGMGAIGSGQLNDMWAFTAVSAALPVKFAGFVAVKQGEQVKLQWSTAQEFGNDHFVVERSSDGVAFTGIGRVAGVGTSFVLNTYGFVDYAPASGVNYYRIRQVDVDGKFAFTSIAVVAFDVLNSFRIVQNPVVGTLRLNVDLKSAQTVTIAVRDVSGNLLISRSVSALGGTTRVDIPVSSLSGGKYFVSFVTGGTTVTRGFVKK